MAKVRRIYTREFKVEAVKLITEKGYSVAQSVTPERMTLAGAAHWHSTASLLARLPAPMYNPAFTMTVILPIAAPMTERTWSCESASLKIVAPSISNR